jgi:predicted secreted acid phosphatase
MSAFAISRALVLAALLALTGCATATREPPNLYPHKLQLRAYVDGGDYDRDIAAVAARAKTWVEERAGKGGQRLTVVFDLDETLLRNWPHMRAMDFGYVHREWDNWVEDAKAPAIEPVREIYRTARQKGVEVVFITGRSERARAGTERNLRAIDCADYVALIFKPEEDKGTTAAFKTAVRQKLTTEGRTIIANVGDQESDLSGGFAERTFKLPNPFYLTE